MPRPRPRPLTSFVPVRIALACAQGCAEPDPDDTFADAELRGLEDGLELYWSFEDNIGSQITDLSGNGRYGNLMGGASLVDSPLGQAVVLDGVDDYVTMFGLRAPALYGGVDGSFTLSARVKVADSSRYNTLCYGCGPFNAMYVGTQAYGAVAMAVLDDQASTGWKWPKSTAGIGDETWTQVTLVVEEGASARWYLDCEADASLEDANIGLIDMGYSSVGQGTAADRWFEGQIDELRVWSRALSDEELGALCPAVDSLAEGLELHWSFEDHEGDQILDLSGNERHGTVVGGGSFVASPTGEALRLDGVDDKVSFAGPRALSLYGGEAGDFSLSARVRVDDASKYNALCFGCGPFTAMYVGDPSARVFSNLWDLDAQAGLWAPSSNGLITDDSWAEITLVVEGGVAARTYHDCSLDAELVANVGLRDPGYSALGESANPNNWYAGEVDELRVWSRALSESEVASICADLDKACSGPIFVDVDAPSGGDGSSWAAAFDDLQAAVDHAATCPGREIWMAEGQYALDPSAPVASLYAPVAIYGGFAGDETSLSQRDVDAHVVRLGDSGWLTRVVIIADQPNDGFGPESQVRLDGVTISGSEGGAIDIYSADGVMSEVVLANLEINQNTANFPGAGLRATRATLVVEDSSFADNQVSWYGGGGIYTLWTSATISGSSFTGNRGGLGDAIHVEASGSVEIVDSYFGDNFGGWAAVFVEDRASEPELVEIGIRGCTFEGNEGAIYLEEATANIEGSRFLANEPSGAVRIADGDAAVEPGAVEIRGCAFVGNEVKSGPGGALRVDIPGVVVINSSFVGNIASTVAGAVFGRPTIIASSFTGNSAPLGEAVHAFAGPDMFMHHCVSYPDTITGPDIYTPYSCVNSNTLGAPQLQLGGVDPFVLADLDLDGFDELYLDPEGPCVGLEDGVLDAIDWASMTVESSQCTDAPWPEPGVHYEPLLDAGVCE
ncbi:right-handed parallel beta-helix repeat-containing protein [Pseudenhygromyxa sp. WMMC2535]|uniref:LamG-like jellyroll fold domain-containing protein n=1 Tax=Pseudenhygromyxa sp. WMMC2535 TaxID=2712867 RepID=UPI001551A29D|nr:LamG-like jellyroll fold domain-containing protein [Pseudenhygromyxa sp. WMMC2535]NVB37741.1 right-handed parallel beta-helix repeat-containing protein [Pseudenhygromyxa sp. WMMC2535]